MGIAPNIERKSEGEPGHRLTLVREMKSATAGADRARTKGGQVPVGAWRLLSI